MMCVIDIYYQVKPFSTCLPAYNQVTSGYFMSILVKFFFFSKICSTQTRVRNACYYYSMRFFGMNLIFN